MSEASGKRIVGNSKLKLVFFGTPDFAVQSLEALVHSHHEVAGVVTQPDRPKGRGRKVVASPIKRLAQERGLSVFQPEKASSPEFVQKLHPETGDVFVLKLKDHAVLNHEQRAQMTGLLQSFAERLEDSGGVCVDFLVLPSCVDTLEKTVTKKVD